MKGLIKFMGILLAGFISISAYATDMNIVQIASGNKDFSTLVSLLKQADLVATLEGKGPFTVFAPTNEAFAAIPKEQLDALAADPATLKSVLLYHVVSGDVTSDKIKAGMVPTVEGQSIDVTLNDGKVFVNGAEVVKADIKASNGVIHVINQVIMPPKK
ncbi:hypothetical protein TUM19329_28850 [Legionella antarctica]|uniref:FAS1 domain-containing protein n=1 Tax=Legionella antarctica TaxID=2708020 RepID=A0A6F8T763_9GAMM|nr:fasciclin domain-containing protein [Legionella antarctica]BCA96524.1 hypothetical protein TUM19329_28850 [Legionella antarctica]